MSDETGILELIGRTSTIFGTDVDGLSEESKINVAKAMIDAGIDLFDKMNLDLLQTKENVLSPDISTVIH